MNFLIDYKIDQKDGEVSQTPSLSQRKMIASLAEALTDEEYHEICHQLFGTKDEFNQVDGDCDKREDEKKFYAVQSALYRGIFWQILSEMDKAKERKIKFEEAEAEWLEEPDNY